MSTRDLTTYETMSAEAFDLTHPLAPKLQTLLKSARGYRKALASIEHLKGVRGERWATASAAHYENELAKCDAEIDAILEEINPNGK